MMMALHNVGDRIRRQVFDGVDDVRVGKFVELELGGDRATAESQLTSMCEKLLANPVIEEYRFEIEAD